MAEKSEDIFSGKSHQFFPGSFVCIFGLSGSGEYLLENVNVDIYSYFYFYHLGVLDFRKMRLGV